MNSRTFLAKVSVGREEKEEREGRGRRKGEN